MLNIVPVAASTFSPARQALLLGLAAIAALAAIVLLVSQLGRSSADYALSGDDLNFRIGDSTEIAEAIADGGPILLPDPSGSERDIYVQHIGVDPAEGWLAFAARASGSSRDCTLSWQSQDSIFQDPCEQRTYPADGAGLTQYLISVDSQGQLLVLLTP